MILLLGLSMAAALRVPWPRLAVLTAAIYQPIPLLGVIGFVVWKTRTRSDVRAALFCEGVAAELRAGTSLRDSVSRAADAVGVGPIAPDSSAVEISALLREAFPEVATELSLTFQGVLRAGNDPATLFDEIGSFALAKMEIDSEVRVATAPGIAAAVVLVGAPMVFVFIQAQSGALGRILASPGQRVAALIGLLVFGSGALVASLVLWRARR